ncbi:hypothetical protein [Chryseobacterium lathyri]|jgi:hypothetical protein|uniref:hypothetical protein n=1 Tax=Chryseobacterium lathyri TaxID=395933 RepID=UPI000DCF8477|nr:hypothetical protein [Chryseobacterium lathyri]
MKKIICTSLLIFFFNTFFSRVIETGKYCTKTERSCLTLLPDNRFEQLTKADIDLIGLGTYSIKKQILTLKYDKKRGPDSDTIFKIIKIKPKKLRLKLQVSKNKNKAVTLYRK